MNLSTKTKTTIFQLSALIILLSAILYEFEPLVARWSMIVGVVGYTVMTFVNRYKGSNIRGKRLFNIQLFSVIAMVVATSCMFVGLREWVVALLIAAVLMFYHTQAYANMEKNEAKQKKEE